MRRYASENSRFFEIARVLVRLDHVASVIINADHSIMRAAAVHRVADGESLDRFISVPRRTGHLEVPADLHRRARRWTVVWYNMFSLFRRSRKVWLRGQHLPMR